ncbi:S9 family peptidase [Kitasatospora fiedleri]|uniref:S9 family peptidase n=1 Tax=Kitasatospora fiedleri TaxID=2991545 RepID=UPI00249B9448|nr:prolyl oligopeptidase family serine peptidase [Kitasatospora fiedleri]
MTSAVPGRPAPGAWPSPIAAEDVAREDGVPGWAELVPEASGLAVWWDEPRPLEGGRRCVVRRAPDGTVQDLLPEGFNARSRLHEYGGRAWRPVSLPADGPADGPVDGAADGAPDGPADGAPAGPAPALVFVDWHDQRLLLAVPGTRTRPRPLTAAAPDAAGGPPVRYGDLYAPPGRAEVWCVRESVGAHPREVRRALVAVPLDGSAVGDPARVRVLADGHDFLACPRLSPDGRHLSWIGWNHPAMPWDGTELCVAALDGTGGAPRVVAGGADCSVVQAEWRDADTLWAVADPDGWWNLRLVPLDGGPDRAVAPRAEEFGGALWRPGATWFAPLPDGRAVAVHGTGSDRRLGVVDPSDDSVRDLPLPYSDFAATVHAADGRAVCVAGSPEAHHRVVLADLAAAGGGERRHETLTAGLPAPHVADWLPRPRTEVFDGADGQPVHAALYPPRNADHALAPGESPPWVVFVHGGPTGGSPMALDLEIAFFTSRGIGVADVDYGGSTGYGRAYRERLRGTWGVVDVADCAAVARGLVARGLADERRLAVRGGSAGGWTALASLTSAGLYAGAVSHYGITDPLAWAADTHDFESRYLDGLIGPLPEAAARYEERSPVRHAHRASGPALLMHGLEDVVVGPEQSRAFAAALEAAGLPCTLLEFPGEQHGWRQSATIVTALRAELAFYRQIFGLTEQPAGQPRPQPSPAGSPAPEGGR